MNVNMLYRYVWVLNGFLIVLAAFLAASTTNAYIAQALVEPRPAAQLVPEIENTASRKKQGKKVDIDAIIRRNLQQATVDVRVETAGRADEALAKATLDARLLGTIVGPPEMTIATIQFPRNKTEGYRVGDELAGRTIELIEIHRVVLRTSSGGLEELLLFTGEKPKAAPKPVNRGVSHKENGSGSEGIRQVSDTSWVIDEAEVEAALSDMGSLLTQARLIPKRSKDGSGIDGFRIFQIRHNSIFQKLGLRNGDVLQEVNGVKLDDPQKSLEVFSSLKNERDFSINLKRHNRPQTFTYEIR